VSGFSRTRTSPASRAGANERDHHINHRCRSGGSPFHRAVPDRPTPDNIDPDTATEGDIPRLLMGGHKIDAIKVYRRVHDVDLKTAKEAVERLAAKLPRSTPA
jgi:hypothetical protein